MKVTIFARKPPAGRKSRTVRGEGRCKHPHCSDCATRRGSKLGIRAERRAAKLSVLRDL